MTIRVLIADDQHLVRAGFRMILAAEPDIEVVAEATDGASALSLVRQTRPDVCLLDIQMPPPDGLEVTRRLAASGLQGAPKVVVVTTFDLDEYVYAALENGASGFLLKDAGPALLVEAVRAAERGDALVSPQVTLRLLRHFAKERRRTPTTHPAERLTEREEEVVRAIARGLTNPEIAAELFIAPSTVKSHITSVQAKVGARNRVEIAAWAFRAGLVT
ncbi:response regulator [Streptomyces phaeochromogenes]|uniref:response regulator n=1 Tax=Streptomyces phaeochromogenes TaxID=1923 RepID=UPI0036BF3E7A